MMPFYFLQKPFRNGLLVLLILAAYLCAFPHAAAARDNQGPDAMSLQDVLRRVYLDNPTLEAARAELRATHELLPQAYANWRPRLQADTSLIATDIEGSNFGPAAGATSKDMTVSIEQPLYRGGRSFAELKAAQNTITAQNAILRSIEQDILRDTGTAYMNVVRDRAVLKLNRNNVVVIGRQLDAAEAGFEAGTRTRTDISQARSRHEQARAGIIRAQASLEASMAAFEALTGFRPPQLLPPAFDLTFPPDMSSAVDIAGRQNPQIIAATYTQKAAEDGVDEVFGELLPEITASASWNRILDPQPGIIAEQTTKSAGVAANIPLYQGGAVRSRVREAKEQANRRYLEILEARRTARQDVVSAWHDLQAACAEIAARQAQVDAAAIAQEGVREELQVGARTVLDTLDADQELLDAEVALVEAKRNLLVAQFSLAAALGMLAPDTLGFSGDAISYGSHLETIKRRILSTDVDRVRSKE